MNPNPPSIHHRRRWFYVLWVGLLVAAAGAGLWWETPGREGRAKIVLELQVQGLPPGTWAALWTGPTADWKGDWNPAAGESKETGERLVLPPRELRIAHRRLRQGLLLRRTHDLAVVALQAPSGERRWVVYDLREDLSGLLTIGRRMTVEITTTWAQLSATPAIPPRATRKPIGH